jgi:type II secretory pathway component GspD/PulD (secretin)
MKIRIKSIVAPDRDSVFLDVFVENSYLARPRIEFDTLPTPGSKNYNYIIETSRSQNRVLLKSGQSTMIGGLIINSQEHVQTGIPFLQDIPVLGLLFSGRRKAIVEKQLLIFVTPTIVT